MARAKTKATPVHLQDVAWLPRGWSPVAIGFAPSREAWEKVRYDFNNKSSWPGVEAIGRTQIMVSKTTGEAAILVILMPPAEVSALDVILTLAHEAVHVFQFMCEFIGEDEPGAEQEAYGIEQILKGLIEAYRATLGKGKVWL